MNQREPKYIHLYVIKLPDDAPWIAPNPYGIVDLPPTASVLMFPRLYPWLYDYHH